MNLLNKYNFEITNVRFIQETKQESGSWMTENQIAQFAALNPIDSHISGTPIVGRRVVRQELVKKTNRETGDLVDESWNGGKVIYTEYLIEGEWREVNN